MHTHYCVVLHQIGRFCFREGFAKKLLLYCKRSLSTRIGCDWPWHHLEKVKIIGCKTLLPLLKSLLFITHSLFTYIDAIKMIIPKPVQSSLFQGHAHAKISSVLSIFAPISLTSAAALAASISSADGFSVIVSLYLGGASLSPPYKRHSSTELANAVDMWLDSGDGAPDLLKRMWLGLQYCTIGAFSSSGQEHLCVASTM